LQDAEAQHAVLAAALAVGTRRAEARRRIELARDRGELDAGTAPDA
jgi:hypothetical protein